MTLFEAKQSAIKMLNQLNFQTPILDVNCLLQFLLNQDSTYILTHHQVELTQKQINDFFSLVEKRKTGLPIAYITSSKEFYSIDFYVTPDVLIPKPDTEILVEHAIEKILSFPKSEISIVDVCTGSGCIGLSVLKNCLSYGAVEKKKAIDLAVTDLSLDALKVAKNNAQRIFKDEKNIFDKIEFLNGDLLCKKTSVDFILSNPPYVPHKEVDELLLDGRNEPRLALDGDIDSFVKKDECISNDGLEIIRRLVPMAYDALNFDGFFLMESGEYQVEIVKKLFSSVGFTEVYSLNDLSGLPRVTVGKKVRS